MQMPKSKKRRFSMNIWQLSNLQTRCLLPLTISLILPGFARADGSTSEHQEGNKGDGHDRMVTVLYEGPLVHDQDWTIKAGPRGPENQKFRGFGGTCSMVASEVHNVAGSALELVTFSAEREGLGLWNMAFTDTVRGTASDGNKYIYSERLTYASMTTDGRPPRPNRAMPSSEGGGFLQIVPENANPDVLDLIDFFVLQSPGGDVVADSNVHWSWRLQMQPASLDPPPAFFPALNAGRYLLHSHDQLAGQLGCDPL
jgi:hypothetical protein